MLLGENESVKSIKKVMIHIGIDRYEVPSFPNLSTMGKLS